MIKRILIANRGEIVSRIMRTCGRMGIETVVCIFRARTRMHPYVEEADRAYCIGPANPAKRVIWILMLLMQALKESGADAVHQGYGFLSEAAAFAEAVTGAGVKWIGPAPEILVDIESKCYCRQLAQKLGIPVTPGTLAPVKNVDEIIETAQAIGIPILLKLDKGGGGKGIEILNEVANRQAVTTVYERMQRIGEMAFASGDVYVEKAVDLPRHIEGAVFGGRIWQCGVFG